ncbi:MAG: hypothetical protein ACTSYD_07490 [Candidatus Heimdallarchaeaceae archaeon]
MTPEVVDHRVGFLTHVLTVDSDTVQISNNYFRNTLRPARFNISKKWTKKDRLG